jgi:PhzF family phenazine biosynthesis protein
MRLPVRFVCAFSDVPHHGNPAAVVLLDDLLEEARMQAIAAELAQPITAFVAGARSPYRIRWYTPAVEELLCGHGTVAAVHALTESGRGCERVLRFEYWAGALTAHVTDRGYALELPASPVVTYRDNGAVAQAIGCRPDEIYTASDKIVCRLASEALVAGLIPDFAAVARLPKPGLVVTATGCSVDFVSRYFAPAKGIPEDQVTGSTHAILAPYWAARLGRASLSAAQLSPRGGTIGCEVVDACKVRVAGPACSFLEGHLVL